MSTKNLANLDLNLLKAFDALTRTHSVTLAADELGLTQPAVSHALRRLREWFDDPLLVRASRGLQPTPLALAAGEKVREALRLIEECNGMHAQFDPATSERNFTLFLTDIGDITLVPDLLERMRSIAPRAKLRTLGLPFEQAGRMLESGGADLAVTVLPVLNAGFFQQALFRERYVCIVRKGHPDIGEQMSVAQFRAASHALVVSEGTGHEVIEHTMVQQGLLPNVVLRLSHFAAMPHVVAQSDLVATVPRRLALSIAPLHDLRVLEHPLRLATFQVRQFWHLRTQKDPAHVWLRGQMRELFREGG